MAQMQAPEKERRLGLGRGMRRTLAAVYSCVQVRADAHGGGVEASKYRQVAGVQGAAGCGQVCSFASTAPQSLRGVKRGCVVSGTKVSHIKSLPMLTMLAFFGSGPTGSAATLEAHASTEAVQNDWSHDSLPPCAHPHPSTAVAQSDRPPCPPPPAPHPQTPNPHPRRPLPTKTLHSHGPRACAYLLRCLAPALLQQLHHRCARDSHPLYSRPPLVRRPPCPHSRQGARQQAQGADARQETPQCQR